ncbi:MAG TPA: hypothetical protein VF618_23525 [Thermoanaerobaculia bacterium]
MSWRQRFHARGVFWRHFLRWAVFNVPIPLESIILAFWSGLFMFWHSGRRGIMANLSAVLPHSWAITNFFRAYRVFWNFACTLNDNARFKDLRIVPDWEFVGDFDALQGHPGGAVMLTAHMGSYDLGAHLFTEIAGRQLVMVRAPESDPRTREFEESHRGQLREGVKVGFSTRASDLALDLLHAIDSGELVAIQGDRVTPGIATIPATMFGVRTAIPAGPFALAMAARVPIFPLFIVRRGHRRYQLVTAPAIMVVRRSRNRDADLAAAAEDWVRQLEDVIRGSWHQWFAFEPFSEELPR